jgi:hypothetical protein
MLREVAATQGGRMNDIELQNAAQDYARRVMFTITFGVEKLSTDLAVADPIYTAIHDQLVAAFIAGYRASNAPKGAA